MVDKVAEFRNSLALWTLTAIACAPPLAVMLHPGLNELAEQPIQGGFAVNTPGVKWRGLSIVPSYPLFHHGGVQSGSIHTGSRLDQSVVGKGDTFTLADGSVVAVNSGHFEVDGVRSVPGGSTHHKGVDIPLPVGTPIYAPADGTKVQCWWDGGGGGQVATIWVGPEKYQAMHLKKDSCKPGIHSQGDQIGHTGNTGSSTGPHLHWEQVVQGVKPPPKRGMLQAVLDPSTASAYQKFEGSTDLDDQMLLCIIGNAEGTANDDCSPNKNYSGHNDGGRKNLGFTSNIHGFATPEEADANQLSKLKQATPTIQGEAQSKFGEPLSAAALAMALDLKNQSPDAASRLIKHMPSADPTPAQIINARTAALTESRAATGTGTAPGLNVRRDQSRRVDEGLRAMQQFKQLRQENLDK